MKKEQTFALKIGSKKIKIRNKKDVSMYGRNNNNNNNNKNYKKGFKRSAVKR